MVSSRSLMFLKRLKFQHVLSNTRFTASSIQHESRPTPSLLIPVSFFSNLQLCLLTKTSLSSMSISLLQTKLSHPHSSSNHHLSLLSSSPKFFLSACQNVGLIFFSTPTSRSYPYCNQIRQDKARERQSTEETVLLFSSGAQPKLREETTGQVHFRSYTLWLSPQVLCYKHERKWSICKKHF